MGDHGSAYARFVRALENGNLLMIRAAAAELPQVGLKDVKHASQAFRLMRSGQPERALGMLQTLCHPPRRP